MKINPVTVAAWDIGGAHLKFAMMTADGHLKAIRQLPCPMWLAHSVQRLTTAIHRIARRYELNTETRHAVTMTAELADCFSTREEGVRAIVSCLGEALKETQGKFLNERVRFWSRQGFIERKHVLRQPLEVASMNWLATATFVADCTRESLLIDVGSTTTDITACSGGAPVYKGRTDAERLHYRELVYSGVARTPIMALGQCFDNQPVVAERFAETADIYRITAQLPPEADVFPSCDGREKTPEGSARRLARMFGSDYNNDLAAWRLRAHTINGHQCRMIAEAAEQVAARAGLQAGVPVVGAGTGRFLAAQVAGLLHRPYRDFADLITPPDTHAGHYATVTGLARLLHAT